MSEPLILAPAGSVHAHPLSASEVACGAKAVWEGLRGAADGAAWAAQELWPTASCVAGDPSDNLSLAVCDVTYFTTGPRPGPRTAFLALPRFRNLPFPAARAAELLEACFGYSDPGWGFSNRAFEGVKSRFEAGKSLTFFTWVPPTRPP